MGLVLCVLVLIISLLSYTPQRVDPDLKGLLALRDQHLINLGTKKHLDLVDLPPRPVGYSPFAITNDGTSAFYVANGTVWRVTSQLEPTRFTSESGVQAVGVNHGFVVFAMREPPGISIEVLHNSRLRSRHFVEIGDAAGRPREIDVSASGNRVSLESPGSGSIIVFDMDAKTSRSIPGERCTFLNDDHLLVWDNHTLRLLNKEFDSVLASNGTGVTVSPERSRFLYWNTGHDLTLVTLKGGRPEISQVASSLFDESSNAYALPGAWSPDLESVAFFGNTLDIFTVITGRPHGNEKVFVYNFASREIKSVYSRSVGKAPEHWIDCVIWLTP